MIVKQHVNLKTCGPYLICMSVDIVTTTVLEPQGKFDYIKFDIGMEKVKFIEDFGTSEIIRLFIHLVFRA